MILVEVKSSQLNNTTLTFKCLQVNSSELGVGVGTFSWNFRVLTTGLAACATDLILACSVWQVSQRRKPLSESTNQPVNQPAF